MGDHNRSAECITKLSIKSVIPGWHRQAHRDNFISKLGIQRRPHPIRNDRKRVRVTKWRPEQSLTNPRGPAHEPRRVRSNHRRPNHRLDPTRQARRPDKVRQRRHPCTENNRYLTRHLRLLFMPDSEDIQAGVLREATHSRESVGRNVQPQTKFDRVHSRNDVEGRRDAVGAAIF